MRKSFVSTIIAECERRDDIVIISGDAGLGVFDRFQANYPERFLNLGIAEQNMASFAAGLAMTGYKVFLYNIIPFLLYRCYEQVRNDICYQNLPIVLVGTGSGVTYAPAGISHYAVEDIGLARTLPNLTVLSPCDPIEAEAAARYSLDAAGPVYVRLAKQGEPIFQKERIYDITVPQVIREGAGTAVVFHGSISSEVMAAYDVLKACGHPPLLISVPTIQPMDFTLLLKMLSNVRHVVSVEEHFTNCGLGSILASLKTEKMVFWKLSILGIPPRFIHEIRNSDGLRSFCGISAYDIVSVVESTWIRK